MLRSEPEVREALRLIAALLASPPIAHQHAASAERCASVVHDVLAWTLMEGDGLSFGHMLVRMKGATDAPR